jgi:hypothetical protein
MHGQAYLAETAIGEFGQDERVKVACVRSKTTTVELSLLPDLNR